MSKILFLDVDGVINSRDSTIFKGSLWPLDPYKAFLVGKIKLETNCDVVLSSSWRHHPDGVREVERRVVPIVDITPTLKNTSFRGDEVRSWLSKHPEVEKYAVLDDDSDFYNDQPLFKTTFDSGLNDDIANNVISYLNS